MLVFENALGPLRAVDNAEVCLDRVACAGTIGTHLPGTREVPTGHPPQSFVNHTEEANYSPSRSVLPVVKRRAYIAATLMDAILAVTASRGAPAREWATHKPAQRTIVPAATLFKPARGLRIDALAVEFAPLGGEAG